jgi:hypothetical protein
MRAYPAAMRTLPDEAGDAVRHIHLFLDDLGFAR